MMIRASELPEEIIQEILKKIEVWSFYLSCYIPKLFLMNFEFQNIIAYLIIVIARKKSGVMNYNSELLRKFY